MSPSKNIIVTASADSLVKVFAYNNTSATYYYNQTL